LPSILDAEVSLGRLIYLDTEFTNLEAPQLLSLGMVTASGEELYHELDLSLPQNASVLESCSGFVHDIVLPQWGRVPVCSDASGMGQRTVAWLWSCLRPGWERDNPLASPPLQIVYDHPTDLELLMQLLEGSGEWYPILSKLLQPLDASELIHRLGPGLAYEAAFETLSARGLERHHALADALALRAAIHPLLTPRGIDA
jgi:hypothetical protein